MPGHISYILLELEHPDTRKLAFAVSGVGKSERTHRSARSMSEFRPREGLALGPSLIPTNAPTSTAPPAPARRSVWGLERRRGHPAPPDLNGVEKLMTTLMQAHRQWMSRAPDERFTNLLEMQEFKRRIRENSRFQRPHRLGDDALVIWAAVQPREPR